MTVGKCRDRQWGTYYYLPYRKLNTRGRIGIYHFIYHDKLREILLQNIIYIIFIDIPQVEKSTHRLIVKRINQKPVGFLLFFLVSENGRLITNN